jgi:hypothetical protein
MPRLIVDGMLSGTGIRDAYAGGYVEPDRVGLSPDLVKRIVKWLADYEAAHYYQFKDMAENERLDQEGIAITRQTREELPGTQVDYFSNAKMRSIAIT